MKNEGKESSKYIEKNAQVIYSFLNNQNKKIESIFIPSARNLELSMMVVLLNMIEKSKCPKIFIRILNDGFFNNPLAIDILCLWPPDNLIPLSPTTV